MKRILFVCLGNICRSPGAEAVFTHLVEKNGLKEQFVIDSAGTGAWHVGEKADYRMRQFGQKRGYNLSSIARAFKPEDFDQFDMIIGMDAQNIRDLKSRARNEKDRQKIFAMTDFSTRMNYHSVPDPYFGGDAGFELVLDILEDACEGLLAKIQSEGK
ncbi:MAG: low molecular weight protein-tyrosine-phosphatase [Methylococcaceae bacterium]|nr:low molecular weight protein-tyrosine-phosphatase [Prolixibacteraceae bacterium]